MAYVGGNLSSVTQTIEGGFSVFFYVGTDPVPTVSGANYFSDGQQRGMEKGDFIVYYSTSTNVVTLLSVSAIQTPGLGATASPVNSGASGISPSAFGAFGNGVTLSDVTISAGNGAITSASYSFSQGDVGKLISIPGGVGSVTLNPQGHLNTTIASVSKGAATLAVAPTLSIAGTAVATFGTDDTPALQAAVNAAALIGGTIILGPYTYIISSLTWLSGVSMFGLGINSSILKHIMTTDAVGAMIFGNAGGSFTYNNCQFENFQMDMSAATMVSGYQVLAGTLRLLQPKNLSVTNLYLLGSPTTALAFDYGQNVVISSNIVTNYGRLATAASFGGAGVGCATNSSSSWTVTGNVFNSPTTANSTYGVFFEAETAATSDGDATVVGNTFIGTGTLAAIGDCGLRRFLCVGNHIKPALSSTNTGSGIAIKGGTTSEFAGIRGLISNNVITSAAGDGITMDYTAGIDVGQYAGYVISNNRIQACSGHGIKLVAAAASAMKSVQIIGNMLDGNHLAGITTTGAGGFSNLVINDNHILNNGTAGTTITACGVAFNTGAVADLTMVGNRILDNNTGTQKSGIGVGATVAVTGAFIANNNLQNNATSAINIISGGSLAGIINDNPGYNPVGASSAGAGVSPWTFTAPSSNGTLLLSATTAISALTKNGVTILAGTVGANVPYAVPFFANDAVVVTYTGTLSAIKDVA